MTRLITILALAGAAVCLSAQDQSAGHPPSSAELSREETLGKAFLRTFEFQE